jgi:hypothetical protein
LAKRITIHQNEVSNVVRKAGCIGSGGRKADVSSSIQAVILVVIADVLVTGAELERAILVITQKRNQNYQGRMQIDFLCLSGSSETKNPVALFANEIYHSHL